MEIGKKKHISAGIVSLVTLLIIIAYYLHTLSGKYYSPLSDFFAFKTLTEELFSFQIPSAFKREPIYPLFMGTVGMFIPGVKSLLYAGIHISHFSFIGSIFLLYKISPNLGIKNGFMVSWFFALGSTNIWCATQPLPETLIFFFILLSFHLTHPYMSIGAAALAGFTRYDAVLAAIPGSITALFRRNWKLLFFTVTIVMPTFAWLFFHYMEGGNTNYLTAVVFTKELFGLGKLEYFPGLLRASTLFYLPPLISRQYPITTWVTILWWINILIVLIGIYHITLHKGKTYLKPVFFFGAYLLFLWFYPNTSMRKLYFINAFFPLFTIAGIEYLIGKMDLGKITIRIGLTITVLSLTVAYIHQIDYIKKLYLQYYNYEFDYLDIKNFISLLPIGIYLLLKHKAGRNYSYITIFPLFVIFNFNIQMGIQLVEREYAAGGNHSSLRDALELIKKEVKEDEKIFMSYQTEMFASYLSEIPAKNILIYGKAKAQVTYSSDKAILDDITYIVVVQIFQRDQNPILEQMNHKPKEIIIDGDTIKVKQIYDLYPVHAYKRL
jgi:hypothetical protein